MAKPFANVRVIDFSQVFAGPFCTVQLALLGADVIKIERPGGEEFRQGTSDRALRAAGQGPMFMSANMAKRSITLDLKHPAAKDVVGRLVASADVAVENFRPGVMDRLGFGYGALGAINPKLIYCSISGFGQEGPYKDAPAYDGKIQATSGIMSITGHPEMGPTRAGFVVCDAAAGMTAAFAVASALYQRTHTGQGQRIDLAMLDTALSFLSASVAEYTVAGQVAQQYGNMAVNRRPTADLYRAKDGHLQLSVNTDPQFHRLCHTIGRPDLLQDPRFVDWDARQANREALRAEILDALEADTAENWERRLDAAGAPASQVRNIAQAATHPQLAHRRTMLDFPNAPGVDRPFRLVNAGFALAHGGPGTDRPPPAAGEHTDAVLAEAGYSQAEIKALRADGVV